MKKIIAVCAIAILAGCAQTTVNEVGRKGAVYEGYSVKNAADVAECTNTVWSNYARVDRLKTRKGEQLAIRANGMTRDDVIRVANIQTENGKTKVSLHLLWNINEPKHFLAGLKECAK